MGLFILGFSAGVLVTAIAILVLGALVRSAQLTRQEEGCDGRA